MAVESPIGPRDGWFIGEDKTLRFTVTGETEGIETWQLEWSLYQRDDLSAPLILRTSTTGVAGSPAVPADNLPAIVTVVVPREDTLALRPDEQYSHVLRRVDPGFYQVLSYGPAVLRAAVLA